MATTVTFRATATSAREAHAAGELAAWAQWFNREGGGDGMIADALLREDYVYLMAELPLADIYPVGGPSPSFDHPDVPDELERKVVEMIELFERGWDAPSLFVHLPSYRMVDGGHRRQALLRLGHKNYWAVCWMTRPPLTGRGQYWAPRDDNPATRRVPPSPD
jgi:hypothetical protein